MWRDRIKRLRVVVEHLLQSSDDEDEAQPHMDQYGNHLRRGGYHPTPQQQPDATGQQKWRHPWQASKLSKIFARTDTYDETSFGGKLFRSRTSVPRILFDELVTEAQRYPELPDHRAGDGQGKRGPSCIPLRIKLGGVLNWMRMGGSITSAADFADIDVQTLRRFGKSWARAVMLHEYSKHVCVPTGVALDNILEVHAKHGFPGMLDGVDGVTVQVRGVPWSERNKHKGKDSGVLTRAFNVSGDVRRRIYHVHGSHPGWDNDKTMARFDQHMQAMRRREIVGSFRLYTSAEGDGAPETLSTLYQLSDNGYHAWVSTQYPSKHPSGEDDLYWSARGESVRKNESECIFGILKMRFLLFAGIFDFGRCGPDDYDKRVATFDDYFRVVCMLHNRLQDHDGISDLGTFPHDWKPVNFAHDLARRRARLLQAAGAGGVLPADRTNILEDDAEQPQYEIGHDVLHAKLVRHYACARVRGEVKWLHTAKWSRGLRLDTRPLEAGHRCAARRVGHHGDEEDDEEDDEAAMYDTDASQVPSEVSDEEF